MVQLTFKDQIDSFIRAGESLQDPFFMTVQPLAEPFFVPCHLYTFSTVPVQDSTIPTPDDLLDPKKLATYPINRPYYDAKPIGVCLSDTRDAVTILNIKIPPVGATQTILNVLWQTFNNTISKSYDSNGQFIGEARALYALPEYAQLIGFNASPFTLADLLNRATGNRFNIRYAVNKYQKADITNPRPIPFHLVPRVAQTKILEGIQTRALSFDAVLSPFIK